MKKLKKFRVHLLGVIAIIVGMGSVVVVYNDLRPFPTVAEHEELTRHVDTSDSLITQQVEQIAGRSCKNELSWLNSEFRDIQRQILKARAANNSNWVRTLQEQLRAVTLEIARVKRECGWS